MRTAEPYFCSHHQPFKAVKINAECSYYDLMNYLWLWCFEHGDGRYIPGDWLTWYASIFIWFIGKTLLYCTTHQSCQPQAGNAHWTSSLQLFLSRRNETRIHGALASRQLLMLIPQKFGGFSLWWGMKFRRCHGGAWGCTYGNWATKDKDDDPNAHASKFATTWGTCLLWHENVPVTPKYCKFPAAANQELFG